MASRRLLVMVSVNYREMGRDGLCLVDLVIHLLTLLLLQRKSVEGEVPSQVCRQPALGNCASARDLVPHPVIAWEDVSHADFVGISLVGDILRLFVQDSL